MKIKVIMTDKAMDRPTMDKREEMLSKFLSPDVEVSVDCIKKGPDELDCCTDEAFASPELVKESIKAQKEGYDAIVIYCFSDAGIDAVRENVKIPVIGPCETTIAAAGMLCSSFAVITGESINIPRTRRRIIKNPVGREKLTEVLALDIPTADLRKNPGITKEYLKKVCRKAYENGAEGVLLGCLGMAGYGSEIEKEIPVKVFDPAPIALAYAEMCVRAGICHTNYMYPEFKNTSNVEL